MRKITNGLLLTQNSFQETWGVGSREWGVEGMLGGKATEEIKQGLQQVQQRQLDNLRFTKDSLKGQIVRQECDLIYISIWDADLDNFETPSDSRKC